MARNLKSGNCRKELVRESKAVKSLHFPNRKRIKGKRGGRRKPTQRRRRRPSAAAAAAPAAVRASLPRPGAK